MLAFGSARLRAGLVTVIVLGIVLLAGCVRAESVPVIAPKKPGPTARYHGVWQDRPYHLPDETLRDTNGQRFNLRTSPSTPVKLVYFGYPDCPDVCPTVLSDLASALHRVPPDIRDDVTVLVIVIDPHAKPTRVQNWVETFDPDFVGLRGSPEKVRRAAQEVGVEFHARDEHGVMLHGGQVIAFDRNGDGVLVWNPGLPIEHVAEDLAALVAEQR